MAMLAEPRRKQKFSIDPRGTKWSDDNSKFGQKLLEKFGWQKGKGLGAKEDGKTEHVKVSVKSDLRGVGCTKNQADNWIAHQDDFNALLASLNQSNVEEGSNSDDAVDKVSSLEAKSKTSRARVHYQKFTKGKDLSAKSMQDLDCVFGVRKSKSDPSTPQCQSEENSDNDGGKDAEGEDPLNGGLKTIKSSDSVQEYFAKKMAALKKARSSGTGTADESQDKFDQSDDSTENSITKANKKVTFSFDDGSSNESEEESKKAKKKKKRKTKDLDEETSESNYIVKKKSKKQKRKSESGEKIDNDDEKNKAEVTIEKSRKKDKKRRNKEKSSDEIVDETKNDEEQKYTIEENINESNETVESEILMKKSKKRIKKEKTDKKKAALGNDDISDNVADSITENKKCKKDKISETVDNIEEESSAQKSKKKDKKKKNKGNVDENTCDITEGKISDELEESGGSKKKKSKKRKSCEDPGNDGPARDEKNDEPKKKRKKKSGEDASCDMERIEKKKGKAANEYSESELNTDRNENSSAISKSSTAFETKFENSVSKQAEGGQDSTKEMNFHNTRSLGGRNAATHGHMNEWRGGNRWQAGYHSNRSKNAQDIFGKKGTNISEIKGYQLNNNTGFVKS